MSKRGGMKIPIGVKMDVADVAKGFIDEGGQTIRGHQDNKTKRHISDNDSGVRHHEIDSSILGRRFDSVDRGLNTVIRGIETFTQTVNESNRIKADLEKTLEQEATKRNQALVDLEKAKSSFEDARKKAAMHHESWQRNCQEGIGQASSAWDRLLTWIQSESVDEKTRELCLAQMLELQKNIKEITIAFFEKDSVE